MAHADKALSDHERLSLYYTPGCAYCAEVRRVSAQLGISLDLRNIRDAAHGQDLMRARGRQRVPVLRIDSGTETRWLPESLAIVEYLESIAARRDGRRQRPELLRLRIRLLRIAPFVLLGLSAFTSGTLEALLLGAAAVLAIVRFLPPRMKDEAVRFNKDKRGSNRRPRRTRS